MDHVENYVDVRLSESCVYCGASPETKDHVPSRAFLDRPYPKHLPTVPACTKCNASIAVDEEYLACLIECVVAGSSDPDQIVRPKVRRALVRRPALRARIEAAAVLQPSGVLWNPEQDRVSSVVLKLARGHAFFELAEQCRDEPSALLIQPLVSMSRAERSDFEDSRSASVWPEVGSRALMRQANVYSGIAGEPWPWLEVQADRYRYVATIDPGVVVRIVLREYLACEAKWD